MSLRKVKAHFSPACKERSSVGNEAREKVHGTPAQVRNRIILWICAPLLHRSGKTGRAGSPFVWRVLANSLLCYVQSKWYVHLATLGNFFHARPVIRR